MKKKSLKLNAFLNGFRSLLGLLFPLITFPYVSRILSVDGIGKYNFSNSVVSYFLLIAGLGINTYAIREGAKFRNERNKISNFINEVFTINVASGLVSYFLLFICLFLFAKLQSYLVCILIYSIQIGFSVIGMEWLFNIYEDFAYITVRSMIFQIISLILLFIFVRNSGDYLNYAAITVFSSVGSNILNFIRVKKKFDVRIVFHFKLKKHLIPILILFASNIASLIYINSDVTILGLLKNNYVVGIYSVSSRIYTIIKTVLSSVLLVTIPRLAMLYGKNEMIKYKKLLINVVNALVIIILPAMIGLVMLSKQVILIIAGDHFLRSIISLRILAVAYIFAIFAWILSDCVLIPAKKEKYVLVSTIISAIINIIFNIIFIPYLSENAAALSTVISEFVIFSVNYYYARNIVHNVFISRKLFINVCSSLLGCIGIVISCMIVNKFIHSLVFNTILSILSSFFIYIIILLLLKNKYIYLIISDFVNLNFKNRI